MICTGLEYSAACSEHDSVQHAMLGQLSFPAILETAQPRTHLMVITGDMMMTDRASAARGGKPCNNASLA